MARVPARSGGAFRLKGVTVDSTNDYAAVTVAPLDDRPIASSKKRFVQAGTIIRPTDWSRKPAPGEKGAKGWKVVRTGPMPGRASGRRSDPEPPNAMYVIVD